ncbi:MAG: hypothetical protein R6V23_17075 [Bacteroidales bacterium]
MKNILISLLAITSLLLISQSCNDDDDLGEYSCSLEFKIVDNDNNNLLGSENQYPIGNIKLMQKDNPYETGFSYDTISKVISIPMENFINFDFRKEFYLELNWRDIDTLDISFGQNPRASCMYGYYLKGVKYNGVNLTKDDNYIFTIKK